MADAAKRLPTKKSLKVGLVLDDGLDKPGGVQEYILAIGEWLRHEGHDVHYLVGETKRQDISGVHSLARNVRVRFNGNSLSIPLPTSRRKLSDFLKAENFDILHVQIPYSPFMGQRVVLAASKHTAVIGTFHILPYGRLPVLGNKALGVWLKPSLRRFDQIFSVSQAAADFACTSFGITSVILPNVIDYQRFHNAKPMPGMDDAGPTILFLGRLVPRKGCQLLLEALVRVVQDKQAPAFRVLICGSGPLEAKLRQFVERNGLQDIVEFVGFVTEADKPRFYASADIAVFPSSSGESFGIVLLEAMASGKAAVLAGDNPGYRSVMSPQPNLLFDPKDASVLAEKMVRYLRNSRLRQDMSRWGETYAKGFDVNVVGLRLLDVYYKALLKRHHL